MNSFSSVENERFIKMLKKFEPRYDPPSSVIYLETCFPTIAKMARDYLAVQATSVASESTFSTSGQLITSNRVCLSDESIEASMLCRNWMRFNFSFCK